MRRTVGIILLLASTLPAGVDDPAWLLFSGRDGAFWIRADGKEARRTALPAAPRGDAALSPDGTQWLVARNQRGNGGVFLLPAAGGEMRRLVEETDGARWPSWCADGVRFFYTAPAGDTWQVYRSEVADGPREGRPVTKEHSGVREVRACPDGQRVACTAHAPAQGFHKIPPGDVVVLDLATGRRTVLAEAVHALELSWSPGGDRLAVSTTAGLDLFDPARGRRERRIDPREIDERLFAHGAQDLCWHPDGKVLACRIPFLGGRAADEDGAFERLLGDRELFFLPLEGNPTWIELPEGAHRGPLRWIDGTPPADGTR